LSSQEARCHYMFDEENLVFQTSQLLARNSQRGR